MTADGHYKVPTPVNEPIRAYAPGDPYRTSLKARLAELTDARTDVPMQIGGERRWGASKAEIRSPHRKELSIAQVAVGGKKDFADAIEAALVRYGLALVSERHDGHSQIVGYVADDEQRAWDAVYRLGAADVATVAASLGADAPAAERLLNGLSDRRLLMRHDEQYHALGHAG